ncbi:hypothetical protein [Hoeflea alexandrii]|uniref:hypothetical protein n=1 Tax=Hoeflea alexandrii TaxID=288436 RepID=UPI0022B00D37|nr:hypothetical protein [Hoeflea alexandrii]MCZ4291536.1 hypothetical protein [Hoeflea alexandrii]
METIGDAVDATFAPLGMIAAFAILALILAVMAGLYFFVGRPSKIDTEALQRLAGRRGWAIKSKMAGVAGIGEGIGESGRGYRIEVRPTDGSGWFCEVTRYQNIGRGGFVRKTEFVDPGASPFDGMVVIGPAIPEKEAKAAAMMFGQFEGKLGRMLLSTMLGDAAEIAGDLQLIENAGIPGATVFATPDAQVDRIGAAYAPLLASWLRTHRDEKEFPILIAGQDRLRIRLRTDADSSDRLETFLDHALAARKALSKL